MDMVKIEIVLLLAVAVFFNSAVYGMDLSKRDQLRVPFITSPLTKNAVVNNTWELSQLSDIAMIFEEGGSGYKFDEETRLIGVQVLSMIGVHHQEVQEKLKKIAEKDESEIVRRKAQSVLCSFTEVIIGEPIEVEVTDYKDIRQIAVSIAEEKGIYAGDVYFEGTLEGSEQGATFAVYSQLRGTYLNLTSKGTVIEKMWGNIACLEDNHSKFQSNFGHIHIAFKDEKGGSIGGHLQTIKAKGRLTIRPFYGARIGRDYDVVTFGRKFDPWKLEKQAILQDVKGKRGVVIRLDDDEDLVTKIKDVSTKLGIRNAKFRVIGACDRTKDPTKNYQASVTFINSGTNRDESRDVYHEYLAEGTIAEGRVDATVLLADENGVMTKGELIKLNNRALGEVVLEMEDNYQNNQLLRSSL